MPRNLQRSILLAAVISTTLALAAVVLLPRSPAAAAQPSQSESMPSDDQIRAAVERSLPLLERASAGSATKRKCFTCHSQALPVFAIVQSQRRGFSANVENLNRQIDHTHAFLLRGQESYEQGRGQGGGVDTAGYALWTLEEAGWTSDDVTATVAAWLLTKQNEDGFWKHSSNRPPSEASDFTTTYLALRALSVFGDREEDQEAIELATAAAATWLVDAQAKETEDQVFRMLSLKYVDVPHDVVAASIDQLRQAQNDDGGWSQKSGMESDAYATATVLVALCQAGAIGEGDVERIRAVRFLLEQQLADGSWHVKSRSKPFQTYFESGFPHGKDQFISTTATGWAVLALLQSLPEKQTPKIETLPGTRPLDWPEGDLSQRLMHRAHTFVEEQIKDANKNRKTMTGSAENASTNRRDLRRILGVVEERLPPRMEHFGDAENPPVVAQTDAYQVFQVRWPVFENVMGEGLLVRQRQKPIGQVVVIPDADQSPEEMLGMRSGDAQQHRLSAQAIGRRLADHGFDVVVPSIVSRDPMQTDDPRLQRADYTHREWIYRQGFHMGRHVIGYDIQRVLAAIDWFDTRHVDAMIGMVGYGEGGLIALHTAAIDARTDVTLVSGYFDSSDAVWQEPIYRNVWSRLKHFGNVEVASLIAPRKLVIEHCQFPRVTDHKGELRTPTWEAVKEEFQNIQGREACCKLIGGPDGDGPWSHDATKQFVSHFGLDHLNPESNGRLVDRRASADQWIRARQARTTSQLETHVQSLVRASEHVRDSFFLYKVMPKFADARWSTLREHSTDPAEAFVEAAKPYRKQFHEQAMGRFDEEFLPANARTRKLVATAKWTAYDVVLDVFEGLFSWGVLVVPNDLQHGEQRPVVVCQHGRNGVPRDTIDNGKTAYNDYAARLAERGFITFAPHNLYRGEDQYRWLDRKANTIGCTLFSFIIAQHEATLRWLDSLPFVDGDRIAFYGLSYGGETAVRVPTVLQKYCLSICSGDFNQWTRKVAATDQRFSFMNTIEWEMPYWNLGHTFDYAEMTYLMFPRPFMVERGHHDRVGRDHWVAHEFAKVRWLYAQFGMADRTQIEYFQGGHSIHGQATFSFLHERLNWPLRDTH